MIKNLILDFGGVLYNIRYQNIPEAFARYGLPHFEEIYSKKKQNEVMDLYEEGFLPTPDFRDYIRSLADNDLSDQQIDECWNSILLGFPKEHEQLLQHLSQQYRLFLFSNTNELNYEAFRAQMHEQFGYDIFDRYFEKCYFSQLIHIRKPKPEGFKLILEENGLNPSETLFVDDSPQHLKGAQSCGLRTMHITEENSLMRIFGGVSES